MDASRRCYRVVDSILVERNVGEVKEALEVEKNNVCFKFLLERLSWGPKSLETVNDTLVEIYSLYTVGNRK